MSDISATVTVEDNGLHVVLSTCRDCGAELRLPCELEDGSRVQPTEQLLKWADMIICTRCAELLERNRAQADFARSLEERLKRSGVPESFRKLQFEDMDRSEGRASAVAAAWAWADADQDAGLFLHGPMGSGKTRLAGTAAVRRLQRANVTYCSVAHLIASLQASFSDEDRKQALALLKGSGALILDDVDKVRPTETVLSQLFVAIDRRVQALAPLFVTSNASPAQLASRFGGAIVSRLSGYCQVFELGGRDRRLEGGSR